MNGFVTGNFNRIGRTGIIIDIGKVKELGASRAINLDHNNRDKNSDIKGKNSIDRGLRFRDNSSKDNPGFGNLRDSSNPKGNILSLGGSNARENRNTNSLKENLNGAKQNVDSRR